MAKQEERKNGGRTGAAEPGEHMSIDVVDEVSLSPRVKNWIEAVKNAEDEPIRSQTDHQWPSMPKVPEMLRRTQDSEKYYEPKAISIGPYHHDNPHLRTGETIKPLVARKFLADSNQDIEDLYRKIASNVKAVRACFDASATDKYDDEKLAWMMLLDGCFILQFIHSSSREEGTSDLILRKFHQISLAVELDLFLLENQIPFEVLRLIFEGAKFKDAGSSGGSTSMKDMINRFVAERNGIILPPAAADGRGAEEEEESSSSSSSSPSHLLHLMRSALLGGSSATTKNPNRRRGTQQYFPRVIDLKPAGIFFRPSGTNSLTDISFQPNGFRGCLTLPQMTIDEFTHTRCLNILAYEMWSDDYAVTSYICFLDSLIDDADDVKELKSDRILRSRLGSDKQVAQIFHDIANHLVDPAMYQQVKDRIQEHCDKRVNTWMARLTYDYFNTPWSMINYIMATMMLYLAVIQTYFTIVSSSSKR